MQSTPCESKLVPRSCILPGQSLRPSTMQGGEHESSCGAKKCRSAPTAPSGGSGPPARTGKLATGLVTSLNAHLASGVPGSAPRVAHPGGRITSNAVEATRRFILRKARKGGFSRSTQLRAPRGQEAGLPCLDRDGDWVMAGAFDSLALVSPNSEPLRAVNVFAGAGSLAMGGKLARWQFCAFVEAGTRAAQAASENHGGEHFASVRAFVSAAPRLKPVAAAVDLRRSQPGSPTSVLRHCQSTLAVLVPALKACGTLVMFIEAPVELTLHSGGAGLASCLHLLRTSGYMAKHATVNPNEWGLPVDGEREYIMAMEDGVAATVDFGAYEVPCGPFTRVPRHRCIKEAMVHNLPQASARRASLADPNLQWAEGSGPSELSLAPVHDSSEPAKCVVLGSLEGVPVVSSRGALPGRGRCWVLDEALWLSGALDRCMRMLSQAELLKCYGLDATHVLCPWNASVSLVLFGSSTQPRPAVDCLALLQLLLSKHWRLRQCRQPRPRVIATKIQKLTDIVTPKYVAFVQIWQSKYEAAVAAHVRDGREINLQSWVGDFDEFVQPACRFCTWNLETLQPLKRHSRPCHQISLAPIAE